MTYKTQDFHELSFQNVTPTLLEIICTMAIGKCRGNADADNDIHVKQQVLRIFMD